jgi:uncharacterized membrane protein
MGCMGEGAIDVIRVVVQWFLVAVFAFMGLNHFRRGPARAMAAMIPPALRREGALRPMVLVYFTGVCEIAGAVGLAIPQTRLAASIALVVFLAAVFPANAYAARHRERFGRAAIPFWPRLAGQVVLAALILWVGIAG